MPPLPMLGRSLLYVQIHSVANSCALPIALKHVEQAARFADACALEKPSPVRTRWRRRRSPQLPVINRPAPAADHASGAGQDLVPPHVLNLVHAGDIIQRNGRVMAAAADYVDFVHSETDSEHVQP